MLSRMNDPAANAAPRSGVQLSVQGLRKTFKAGVVAIEKLDLEIAAGSFVALVGPSGCGKSTLLRVIAGLEQQTDGSLAFDSVETTTRERLPATRPFSLGYVFQDAHLMPWRRVLDNAALPLELLGIAKAERRRRAGELLNDLGLGEFLDRYPAELSGGMRMRVSLARALITRPKLLLLDEPFAALDELTRNQLDDLLRNLWRTHGMTVLFVTHSILEAAYLSQRVLVFSKRPARLIADLHVDLPSERDAGTRLDATFLREVSAIQAGLSAGSAE